jgi:hypothetical protein
MSVMYVYSVCPFMLLKVFNVNVFNFKLMQVYMFISFSIKLNVHVQSLLLTLSEHIVMKSYCYF